MRICVATVLTSECIRLRYPSNVNAVNVGRVLTEVFHRLFATHNH